MEHSRGEATFSEPGVPGDLGLLAELGDLGTVAVGLLLLVSGMVVCHTCGPDDMVLGCGTMETTVSDLDCSFPARSVSHSLPIPLHCIISEMPVGTSLKSPHLLPSSSRALSGVSTLGCPSLAGPCGPLLSEPLPPALAYLTVPLGRNKSDDDNSPRQLLFTSGLCQAGPWSSDTKSHGAEEASQRGPWLSQEECGSGPGEVGLNTDSSVGGLFGGRTITGRQLCEVGARPGWTGCGRPGGLSKGGGHGLRRGFVSPPWPQPVGPARLVGDKSLMLALRAWKCSSPFGQWSGEGG